ncbi:hypothetical protein IM660_08595 [Ruania alkalisoli]|uniref:Uncharacterized protein n=1 Tax=Ruania alkalisoli TaxID=2779775 RepID=A0A7M1SXG6_9MICO|nr:hypothetical protein [Ruania alkalisoli]QOR72270.1 hypothetical protein IM660_08595 [Ruania alkalisoli]
MSLTVRPVMEPMPSSPAPVQSRPPLDQLSEAATRLDAARRALATAESAVGVRARLGSAEKVVPLTPPAESDPGGRDSGQRVDLERAVDIPGGLAPLFPAGMCRGSAVQVLGSTSVLLSLAAAAAREGAWCAMVGLPDLGLAAAAELGLPLERTVVVPRPGPDLAAVLGALVDGVDVLVVGSTTALLDRERRTLGSRVRVREAVLLTAGPWPGADVVLKVDPGAWYGIGRGSGMLHSGEVTIAARHRRGDASLVVRARRSGNGWESAQTPALDMQRPGELVRAG